MDLSVWMSEVNSDIDYLFMVDLRFDGQDGAGEEGYLTGAFIPGTSTQVPEPASMILLLGGLLGVLGIKRK